MKPIETAFKPALIRTVEISYRCDLTRVDGRIIPLGVMSDFSVQGVFGLGICARRTLSKDDAGHIGELIRKEISEPFKFLKPTYDEILLVNDPKSAFGNLTSAHSHSLSFVAINDITMAVPRPIVTNAEARRLWAEDQLKAHCAQAFWKLFGDHVPDPIDRDEHDETRAMVA